jgi:hypothetical protein
MYIDRRKVIIIGIAALVLAALIVGAILIFGNKGNLDVDKTYGDSTSGDSLSGDSIRNNTLALAKDYIDRGEYQRALDLLDKLLIENAADSDARILQDEAIVGNKNEREAAQAAAQSAAEAASAAQQLAMAAANNQSALNNQSAAQSAEQIAAQRRLE